MKKADAISAGQVEHLIQRSNQYAAERDEARKLNVKLLLILEDIAFSPKPDARKIARKALDKYGKNS